MQNSDLQKSLSISNMSEPPKKKIFKYKTKREFKFRGRNYSYQNSVKLDSLSKKLKLTKGQIKDLVKGNTERVLYNHDNQTTKKVDISKAEASYDIITLHHSHHLLLFQ